MKPFHSVKRVHVEANLGCGAMHILASLFPSALSLDLLEWDGVYSDEEGLIAATSMPHLRRLTLTVRTPPLDTIVALMGAQQRDFVLDLYATNTAIWEKVRVHRPECTAMLDVTGPDDTS